MHTIASPALWITFAVIVLVALAADLLMMRSLGPHRVRSRAVSSSALPASSSPPVGTPAVPSPSTTTPPRRASPAAPW